jgi:uncharacterized protein (TIGR02145 family)
MKRNASFNLDEIKVRWKKAALENCTGVPCVVTPPPPPPPSFTCGTSTVTDVDGNSYNTVSIGTGATTQCWTASNLKVTKYSDGVTPIPDQTSISPSTDWGNLQTGARTDYLGATGIPSGQTYVSTYGYLYNWFAVNDAKGLCPSGWHVPTDAEWTTLEIYLYTVAPNGSVGNKMKSPSLLWTIINAPTLNSSGFTALPGGVRIADGNFYSIRETAYFWSATPNVNNAMIRFLNGNNDQVTRNNAYDKSVGLSVRCLKD